MGGGYIALELGQMFCRFGAEVILLERSAQLLAHGYEPEVGLALAEIVADEGIQVVTRATVTRVHEEAGEVVASARVGGREQAFRAEKMLIATGRQPNTDAIDIGRAGVAANARGEVEVDEFLRTTVPHIFAAGDVIGHQVGSQMATPVGSRDGGIAAHNALSGGSLRRVDHRVVPRVIFTDPQAAVVGLTEEAAMALHFRARLQDFIVLLHAYPTMAEALKLVAISRFKDPRKLSCCAE